MAIQRHPKHVALHGHPHINGVSTTAAGSLRKGSSGADRAWSQSTYGWAAASLLDFSKLLQWRWCEQRGREEESSSVALAAQPHSSTVGLQSAVLRASQGFPHGSPSLNPVTLHLVSIYSTVLEILKREEEEGKEKQTELWAASKFPKRPFSGCYEGKGGGLIGSVTQRRCETRSEERMALRPGNGTVTEWGNLSVEVSDYNVSNTNRSVFSKPARARGKSTQFSTSESSRLRC